MARKKKEILTEDLFNANGNATVDTQVLTESNSVETTSDEDTNTDSEIVESSEETVTENNEETTSDLKESKEETIDNEITFDDITQDSEEITDDIFDTEDETIEEDTETVADNVTDDNNENNNEEIIIPSNGEKMTQNTDIEYGFDDEAYYYGDRK